MAGGHGIGYCRLVIENARGETVRDDDELFVVSRSGRPDTGNWVTVAKVGRFVVDRVEFVPGGTRANNFVYPILYLRPVGAPRTSPTDRTPKRPTTILPSGHEGTRKVIAVDFAGANPSTLQAVILPAALVANLVSVGYRLQASDFDEEKRYIGVELRDADDRLRAALVGVLDALSREAKAHAVQSQLFFNGAAATPAEMAEPPPGDRKPGLALVRGDGGDWLVDAA